MKLILGCYRIFTFWRFCGFRSRFRRWEFYDFMRSDLPSQERDWGKEQNWNGYQWRHQRLGKPDSNHSIFRAIFCFVHLYNRIGKDRALTVDILCSMMFFPKKFLYQFFGLNFFITLNALAFEKYNYIQSRFKTIGGPRQYLF